MTRINLVLLSLALVACDNPTTPSGNVPSSSMYASIFAIDDGSETSIITQLRTASTTQYPNIALNSGDKLYVSSIGTSSDINRDDLASFGGAITISEGIKPLQRRDMVINDFLQNTYAAPEYAATFPQTNTAGVRYYLNFERELYTSIMDVPITLPAPFTLTTPLPATLSRSQNLDLTWIPSSDGTDTMSYQTVWFCEDSLGTSDFSLPIPITDSGNLSIAQPALPNAPCAVTVVLYRELVSIDPAYNSQFGLGNIIRGVQRRHLSFYSIP